MTDLPDVPGPPAPFPDGALRLIGQALLEDVVIPVRWSEALAAAGLDPPQGTHGPAERPAPRGAGSAFPGCHAARRGGLSGTWG